MAEQNNQTVAPDAIVPPNPGQTIVPAGAPRPADQRVSALDIPEQPEVTIDHSTPPPPPEPISQPAPISAPVPAVDHTPPPPTSLPPAPVSRRPQPTAQTQQFEVPNVHPHSDGDGAIVWTASEFVSHEKSSGWYGALALAAVLGSGLIYLFTRDVVSIVVVVFCAIIFGIYAARKPKQVDYRISDYGISVGHKVYPYEDFKSFSVAPDGAFSSIIFRPLKRFATLKTIYFAPEDEDLIVELLADCLPFEEHVPDAVDRLMHRIRF